MFKQFLLGAMVALAVGISVTDVAAQCSYRAGNAASFPATMQSAGRFTANTIYRSNSYGRYSYQPNFSTSARSTSNSTWRYNKTDPRRYINN